MRKFIVIMILLGLIEIGLALYLTEWRHVFWNYVQDRNMTGFINYLIIFTIVALSLCVTTASASYAGAIAAIKWREKLNTIAITKHSPAVENSNQRVQEDCREYPLLVLSIGFGTIKSIVYFFVFSITLIIQFNFYYLIFISIYAIIATVLAKKIASPLIALNYKSQQVEASYRNNLTEINFSNCINVMLGVAKKTKHLQYFQSLYSQIGVVIPLVIIAPAYFAGKMSLGGLMQCNSILSTIVESLSYGVNSFDSINRLLSCRKRLKELGVI